MTVVRVVCWDAAILYFAFLFLGGSVGIFMVFAFFIAIPYVLICSAVIHVTVFEFFLKVVPPAYLKFSNLLAVCAVISFGVGYFFSFNPPSNPPWSGPVNSLLEDYAASQMFYALVLYLMCIAEWRYIKTKVVAPR